MKLHYSGYLKLNYYKW